MRHLIIGDSFTKLGHVEGEMLGHIGVNNPAAWSIGDTYPLHLLDLPTGNSQGPRFAEWAASTEASEGLQD